MGGRQGEERVPAAGGDERRLQLVVHAVGLRQGQHQPERLLQEDRQAALLPLQMLILAFRFSFAHLDLNNI